MKKKPFRVIPKNPDDLQQTLESIDPVVVDEYWKVWNKWAASRMLDTEAVEEDEDGESLASDDDDDAPNEMDLNDPFINDGEIEVEQVEQVKKMSVEEKRKALEQKIERLQKRLKKIDDSDVVLYE